MEKLLAEIRLCQLCSKHLPHGPRPVLQASENSRILIIGQAPGKKVHETGIPWNDSSGDKLRQWLGVGKSQFYDPELFALVPMGFCYPGAGKTGDLPPRPECAPAWHRQVLGFIPSIRLTLLIGQYAQAYYLKGRVKHNLTETVRCWREYAAENLLPLPHPSPLNFRWQAQNKWFETELAPEIATRVAAIV
jgi:uracil-DNA glycosylase